MKNISKIFYLFFITAAVLVSCSDDDRWENNPETGWVEFMSAASTTGQAATSHSVALNVAVPIYKQGLNISYTFTAVEGDYTNYVSTTGGTAFADPSDATRNVTIDIPLMNMDAGRDFTTSFDITLTAVDKDGVTVGIDGASSILVHRVTIPCSNPAVLPNDYFVGDYIIADVVATIGPNNGTENFEGGTVTLTVNGGNPNQRDFNVTVLPAFLGGTTASIEFTTANVVELQYLDSGIGCTAPPYAYSEAGANNSSWDICNDDMIIVNYTEDPEGSCGGPYEASFSLTKI